MAVALSGSKRARSPPNLGEILGNRIKFFHRRGTEDTGILCLLGNTSVNLGAHIKRTMLVTEDQCR